MTKWRLGGTYKPLAIALPVKAQPGDFWRLCLIVLPAGQSPALTIDLMQPDFGRLPFPVTSLPIGIATNATTADRSSPAKGKKSRHAKPTQSKPQKTTNAAVSTHAEQPTSAPQIQAQKQERIERFYQLPVSPHRSSEHGRVLCITEQTSFDLDKVGSLRSALLQSSLIDRSGAQVENMVSCPAMLAVPNEYFDAYPPECASGTRALRYPPGSLNCSPIHMCSTLLQPPPLQGSSRLSKNDWWSFNSERCRS